MTWCHSAKAVGAVAGAVGVLGGAPQAQWHDLPRYNAFFQLLVQYLAAFVPAGSAPSRVLLDEYAHTDGEACAHLYCVGQARGSAAPRRKRGRGRGRRETRVWDIFEEQAAVVGWLHVGAFVLAGT